MNKRQVTAVVLAFSFGIIVKTTWDSLGLKIASSASASAYHSIEFVPYESFMASNAFKRAVIKTVENNCALSTGSRSIDC